MMFMQVGVHPINFNTYLYTKLKDDILLPKPGFGYWYANNTARFSNFKLELIK